MFLLFLKKNYHYYNDVNGIIQRQNLKQCLQYGLWFQGRIKELKMINLAEVGKCGNRRAFHINGDSTLCLSICRLLMGFTVNAVSCPNFSFCIGDILRVKKLFKLLAIGVIERNFTC